MSFDFVLWLFIFLLLAGLLGRSMFAVGWGATLPCRRAHKGWMGGSRREGCTAAVGFTGLGL